MADNDYREHLIDRVLPSEPTSLSGARFGIIGFVLLVVMALATIGWNSYQTTKWPGTDGIVQDGSIEFLPGRSRSRDRYEFKLAYSYQVAGSTYSGTGEKFYSKESDAEQSKRNYVQDQAPLRVYYNPSQPGDSTINPGAAMSTVLTYCGFGMFLALLILYIFVGGKAKFQYQSTPESDEEIVRGRRRGPVLLDYNEVSDRIDKHRRRP